MKILSVLLVVALVGVAVFLLRRARNSGSSGYKKRFDSTLPQQDSSYVFTPVIISAADSAGHHGQSTDCGTGSVDGGSGCSDGGGGN